MSTKELRSRREFLKDSSTIAAGAALASGLSLSIARSAHAQGGDTLRVALIGCGGRGNGAAANNLKACENTKIVAVADAFEAKAKNAATAAMAALRLNASSLLNYRSFVSMPGQVASNGNGEGRAAVRVLQQFNTSEIRSRTVHHARIGRAAVAMPRGVPQPISFRRIRPRFLAAACIR